MDKAIQFILIKSLKCIKLMIFPLLFCLLLSCGKSKKEEKEINTNKTAIVKLSEKSSKKVDGNIDNNQQLNTDIKNVKTNNIAKFTKIAKVIDKLKYEDQIAEIRKIYRKEREKERKKEEEEWKKEYKRLGKLYYQYSNFWENIPDDYDRLLVTLHFINHDEKRARDIIKNLINSENANVASKATTVLAVTYEHEDNYEKAMQIYKEGENHFLKGEMLENVINNLTDEEKIQLGRIYHVKAIAYFMKKDYANSIKAYDKSARLYSSKPIVQSSKYAQLASAYGITKNKEGVLKSLDKALECLPEQCLPEQVNSKNVIQFIKIYNRKKSYIQKRDNAKENKLPSSARYH